MTNKHTQGQWHIGKDGDVWANNGSHLIHQIPDTLDAQANARLIAASPDMLEALERIRSVLENCIEKNRCHVTILECLSEQAQSAIAKARGV